MAVPYLPLGISAAVLGGILLFAPRAEASDQESIPLPPPSPPNTPPIGPVVPNTERRWPAGTPVGIVAVRPGDPLLQGRQAGVRVNQRPATRASGGGAVNGVRPPRYTGDPADDIASGERIAIRGESITNAEGTWREIETFTGARGYVRVVDPNGVVNITKAQESAPWPGGNEPAAVAGVPGAYNPYAYPRIGACPQDPYGRPVVGCPPGANPAYGWAPWGSAWAGSAIRTDVVGQGAPGYPSGLGQCRRPCQLYGRMERGPGFTVIATIPAGAVVRVDPSLGPGFTFGGAQYVPVRFGDTAGWVSPSNLVPFQRAVRPRVFGRYRPGLGGLITPRLPPPPPVLR